MEQLSFAPGGYHGMSAMKEMKSEKMRINRPYVAEAHRQARKEGELFILYGGAIT